MTISTKAERSTRSIVGLHANIVRDNRRLTSAALSDAERRVNGLDVDVVRRVISGRVLALYCIDDAMTGRDDNGSGYSCRVGAVVAAVARIPLVAVARRLVCKMLIDVARSTRKHDSRVRRSLFLHACRA